MSGKKGVIGMYVGQNESAKFWLSLLNGLKNRGVEAILIACVDGLSGFPHAIEGFNRQLRKVTKSKTVFPSDDSLLNILYLAMMDITKKWTGHRFTSSLRYFFENGYPDYKLLWLGVGPGKWFCPFVTINLFYFGFLSLHKL